MISPAQVEERFLHYASPVVLPLWQASNASGGREQLERLKDTFESVLRFAAFALLGAYRAEGHRAEKVEKALHKVLAEIADGKLMALLRELLAFFAGKEDGVAAEVAAFFHGELDDEQFHSVVELAELCRYNLPSNARETRNALDVLVEVRNKFFGHGATRAAEPTDDLAPEALDRKQGDRLATHLPPLVLMLVERVRALAERPLVEVRSLEVTAQGRVAVVSVWNGLNAKSGREVVSADVSVGHLYLKGSGPGGGLVDLFPFCIAAGCARCRTTQIGFLNEVKKGVFSYLFFQCGEHASVNVEHPLYETIRGALGEEGVATAGVEGIPPWLREKLKVAEESEREFHAARALLDDGDRQGAVRHLEHALATSPGYQEATRLLVEILQGLGRFEDADRACEGFLRLQPNHVEVLTQRVGVLRQLRRDDEAEGLERRLRELALHDPAGPLAADARKETGTPAGLPYDLLGPLLRGKARWTRWAVAVLVVATSAVVASLFFAGRDPMMGVTVLAFGVLWLSVVFSTYRVHRLVAASEQNLAAFLATAEGESRNEWFARFVRVVFGDWPAASADRSGTMAVLRRNRTRVAIVTLLAVGATFWAFVIAKFSARGLALDVAYAALAFLMFLSFFYLCSCLVQYHRLLRELRFQRIHFSLVQHPKLSIRYLSYLSRKITYPMLWVYLMFSVVLYLGPFLSNMSCIFAFTGFLVFVLYIYYSTIFLIRGVIIRNKWRLISEFSVHFHGPFGQLVRRAHAADMQRLKELLEIRDFLDSIDVWAERRRVLLATSLMYIVVIAVGTFGLSNAMTRFLVPRMAAALGGAASYEAAATVPAAGPAVLEIDVADVDDSVLVLWADSQQRLEAGSTCPPGDGEPATRAGARAAGAQCRRCDWGNGVHGAMKVRIPLDTEEVHVLIVAVNKVYHSPIGMGGGKLSYDIECRVGGRPVLEDRRFLRVNRFGLGYVATLELVRQGGGIAVAAKVGRNRVSPALDACLKSIETSLRRERDAGLRL